MQKHLEIVKKQFESDNYAKSLGIVLDELTDDTIEGSQAQRWLILVAGIQDFK